MENCLVVLIVRKYGTFLERTNEPTKSFADRILDNIGATGRLLGHIPLPLPEALIREALERDLRVEKKPQRREAIKIGLNRLEDYSDCLQSPSDSLQSILQEYDNLRDTADSFTKDDLERAVRAYLAGLD